MVGQLSLVSQILGYSVEDFPHSILLLGESGCGKHTIVNEIVKVYDLELIDITESICLDTITEASLNLIPTLYLIDLNKVTERQQNIILKFLEEPSERVYIALICTSRSLILDTVFNRCVTFEFKPYSQEELKGFLPKGVDGWSILRYCHTPGQVKEVKQDELDKIIKTCDKMVTVLHLTNYSNLFNLVDTLKSFNLQLFYNVLLDRLLTEFSVENDKTVLKLYNIVEKSLSKMMDSRYDVDSLLISLVTELWEASKESEI